MQNPLVRLVFDEELATLTLTHPAKRNALSLEMLQALQQAVHQVGASGARALVLAAEGPVFSAGHDFSDMAGADAAQARTLLQTCTALMQSLRALPQPVVAQVHALATAAGCQLVASCDLAVAGESARFALPGGKAGLFCHTPLVPVLQAIGPKRALELAFTGDAIDAATACQWGLVNQVVPDADLSAATRTLALRASRGSAASKALGKQCAYQHLGLPLEQAYPIAQDTMARAILSDDAQEGIAAFLEKRPPSYPAPHRRG
ncbi:MAG: enoyl-CoA hydratase-related protein [Rhodoferax sp.]